MIINVNLMIRNVIQIKSGITNCIDVSVKINKNILYAKTIMFGILVQLIDT